MGGLFEAAIKICDDCGRSGAPLSWSQDGNTKICGQCHQKRGARETGDRSSRSFESELMEQSIKHTKS